MMESRFDYVIVMGAGKIACDCIRELLRYPVRLLVIETKENNLSQVSQLCRNHQIDYVKQIIPKELDAFLDDWVQRGRLLIVSANNRYLFKKRHIDMENVEIINFHYGLLPEYRGVNIPTWVIYNEEEQAGITWHYVVEKIDGGNVIARAAYPITEDTTAFYITRRNMQLGADLFRAFIENILDGTVTTAKMEDKDGILYKSNVLPRDGMLSPDMDFATVYKMLRAFDYGVAGVVPPLKINGQNAEVISYKVYPEDKSVEVKEGEVLVTGGNRKIVIKIRNKRKTVEGGQNLNSVNLDYAFSMAA